MTTVWIVVGALGMVVAFLAFALAGAVRMIDELRRLVQALESEVTAASTVAGISIGAAAPEFEARSDRGPFVSRTLEGRRRMIVFADPGCVSCETFVPSLLDASASGELPPSVVIVPSGDPPWASNGDGVVVRDEDGAIEAAFGPGFVPHAYVLDEGGSVAAHGPVDGLERVRELLREAEGIQIIHVDAAHA